MSDAQTWKKSGRVEVVQEMQEVSLGKVCRIGAWQSQRHVDAERHCPAMCRRLQPGEECRDRAHGDRLGEAPDVVVAASHRDPAFAGIYTPVRMRDDCRYSGFCARSSRREKRPGFFGGLIATTAFSLARVSASCWRCLLFSHFSRLMPAFAARFAS